MFGYNTPTASRNGLMHTAGYHIGLMVMVVHPDMSPLEQTLMGLSLAQERADDWDDLVPLSNGVRSALTLADTEQLERIET